MKLYFPNYHYNPKYRGHVFPLLKPFLKPKDFSHEQRLEMYGILENDFSIVEDLTSADLAILTMSWNYYVLTRQMHLANDFIALCDRYNKTVWIINVFDSPLKFSKLKHCILFEPGVYASKLTTFQRVMPIFIKDPLKTYYNQLECFERLFQNIPTIGFCGLANGSKFHKSISLLKIGIRNISSFLGFRHLKSERFLAPSYFRYSVLSQLKKSKQLQTNFIIRPRYSGVGTKDDRVSARLEFYDNIKDSDYVVCIRGAGNFSVRFYETLAMGRIPIFINTDSLLPLGDIINWKAHVVWIEQHELPTLGEKILSFHRQLDDHKLNKLFKRNRSLWENYLQMPHFFNKTYYENKNVS